MNNFGFFCEFFLVKNKILWNHLNKRQRIPKVQSKMVNPEKLTRRKGKKLICVEHNLYMCKQCKQDMTPPTNKWR